LGFGFGLPLFFLTGGLVAGGDFIFFFMADSIEFYVRR